MKNGVDFIYEYSDLNLFQTRVKILTGKYAGIILEFGGSVLVQVNNKNTFTFDYILYEVPDQFYGPRLRTDGEFNQYLGYLLVHVIQCRNLDPNEKAMLEEAASADGKQTCNIKISDKWYPNKLVVYAKGQTKEQPKTSLGSF